ncbi:MAG: DUF2089 domain-containing protein [Candidatus Izemoplasmatales bacterium]|jgi:hypothetical protein|nr:DUF2089 domain-containing protein [Candidatus Izemoplasmatales bacterium]
MSKFDFNKGGFNPFKDMKPKAKYPVISECPVCHHDLEVKVLSCDHCGTQIEGRFTLSKFNYLDSEKLFFIEMFVKNRGNIKAIEKEMDLSYPTIKKILDDVIAGLGYTPDQSAPNDESVQQEKDAKETQYRMEILEKLNNKEMTAEEAAEALKKIKVGGSK